MIRLAAFIFMMSSLGASAQQYFNKIVPFEYGNILASSFYEFDDKILIPGIYGDNKSALITFEQNLDITQYTLLDGITFSKKPLSIIDKEVIFFAKDKSEVKGLKLSRLNNQLQFDWQTNISTFGEYNFPTWSTLAHNAIYNSFIVEDNGIKKIGIHKSSINGECIWTKYYENNIGYSYLWKTNPTLNDNLLFSYTLSHQNENNSYPYIAKIDSSGSTIWKSSPIEMINSGADPIWFTELSNSTIVYTYRILRWGDPVFLGNNWNIYPMRIAWLDKNGESIKQDYMISPYNEIINVGGVEKGKNDYFFIYGEYEAVDDQFGFINKYNNQGDTIWTHRYQHPDYAGLDATHYIKYIVEQDNGEIIALGTIRPTGEQSEIWLFSLNEEGCFTSSGDCGEIVSSTSPMPEVHSDQLILFPNPTDNFLNIYLSNGKMNNVKLLDMHGTLLQELNIHHAKFEMNVQSLVSGLYLLRIVDSAGNVYVHKFIRK